MEAIGAIKEIIHGKWFEVFEGKGDFDIPEATHRIEIYSLKNSKVMSPYRAAKVLKTVAYVAVDEDESGIVWEKWDIKWMWKK